MHNQCCWMSGHCFTWVVHLMYLSFYWHRKSSFKGDFLEEIVSLTGFPILSNVVSRLVNTYTTYHKWIGDLIMAKIKINNFFTLWNGGASHWVASGMPAISISRRIQIFGGYESSLKWCLENLVLSRPRLKVVVGCVDVFVLCKLFFCHVNENVNQDKKFKAWADYRNGPQL